MPWRTVHSDLLELRLTQNAIGDPILKIVPFRVHGRHERKSFTPESSTRTDSPFRLLDLLPLRTSLR